MARTNTACVFLSPSLPLFFSICLSISLSLYLSIFSHFSLSAYLYPSLFYFSFSPSLCLSPIFFLSQLNPSFSSTLSFNLSNAPLRLPRFISLADILPTLNITAMGIINSSILYIRNIPDIMQELCYFSFYINKIMQNTVWMYAVYSSFSLTFKSICKQRRVISPFQRSARRARRTEGALPGQPVSERRRKGFKQRRPLIRSSLSRLVWNRKGHSPGADDGGAREPSRTRSVCS